MSHQTDELKKKLIQFGIEPKKSLGQNFLVSDAVIQKIISAVKNFNVSQIIEIGPGLGALTDHLFLYFKDQEMISNYILLEWDHIFSKYWASYFDNNIGANIRTTKKFSIIDGDALRWRGWSDESIYQSQQSLLVSNLPYQISSSIVIDRCIDEHQMSAMVLMFQKEVAQRITAAPRTEQYGMLTVMAQTFWKVSLVAEAGPSDFYPPPKVASRVLQFIKKSDTDKFHGHPKKFLKLIKAGFSQRRKLLKSNLGSIGFNLVELEPHFTKLNLNMKCRAEELSINQWIYLYKLLEYKL